MGKLIILSGGLDSTTALYKLVRDIGVENVLALTFNYGSKHNENEGLCALHTCNILGVKHIALDARFLGQYLKSNLLIGGGDIPNGHYAESNMSKTVVPFRNGIMLSIACGIAESNDCESVVIGNHAGDHAIYPDCRATFIEAFREAMAYGTYKNVRLESPFCSISKADIVKLGDNLHVDWANTYSCYNGQKTHCGTCSTCYERREAFFLAEVQDPTLYKDKTPFLKLKRAYEEKLQNENASN